MGNFGEEAKIKKNAGNLNSGLSYVITTVLQIKSNLNINQGIRFVRFLVMI